ncbi:MAG: hypothetical protein GPJ54_09210 [Candidatus Heimdallarchaeota archaeon]|nr:hypothetical protein [Candidatus Heimdallarchaeota archaeon]
MYAIELALILIISGLFFFPATQIESFLIIVVILPLIWPVGIPYLFAYPGFRLILIPFIILNFYIAWYLVDKKVTLQKISTQNT